MRYDIVPVIPAPKCLGISGTGASCGVLGVLEGSWASPEAVLGGPEGVQGVAGEAWGGPGRS